MMTSVLKGLVAALMTVVMLAVATIIYLFLQMRAESVNAATIPVFREWTLNSPLYWLLMLGVVGGATLFFRRWVRGR